MRAFPKKIHHVLYSIDEHLQPVSETKFKFVLMSSSVGSVSSWFLCQSCHSSVTCIAEASLPEENLILTLCFTSRLFLGLTNSDQILIKTNFFIVESEYIVNIYYVSA